MLMTVAIMEMIGDHERDSRSRVRSFCGDRLSLCRSGGALSRRSRSLGSGIGRPRYFNLLSLGGIRSNDGF